MNIKISKLWRIIVLFSFLTLRSWMVHAEQESGPALDGLMNVHEHIQSIAEVPKFLEAMKRIGVAKTVLLGSPKATFVPGSNGFTEEDKNNLEILKISKAYPGLFIPFTTMNPKDPAKLEKFIRYLAMGARGLKLYSGNKLFYELALDDPAVLPVYEFCEEQGIPVLFHVNAGYYQKEFEHVLSHFPKLKVICPHFCLSTIKSERFESLMDQFPNLYVDVSFGHMDYLTAAVKRFSRNPAKYRALIVKYQDRILFGTDLVVTRESYKNIAWLTRVAQVYRDFLEKEHYTFFMLPDQPLRGLDLEEEILRKIYRTNFDRFFNGRSDA